MFREISCDEIAHVSGGFGDWTPGELPPGPAPWGGGNIVQWNDTTGRWEEYRTFTISGSPGSSYTEGDDTSVVVAGGEDIVVVSLLPEIEYIGDGYWARLYPDGIAELYRAHWLDQFLPFQQLVYVGNAHYERNLQDFDVSVSLDGISVTFPDSSISISPIDPNSPEGWSDRFDEP